MAFQVSVVLMLVHVAATQRYLIEEALLTSATRHTTFDALLACKAEQIVCRLAHDTFHSFVFDQT